MQELERNQSKFHSLLQVSNCSCLRVAINEMQEGVHKLYTKQSLLRQCLSLPSRKVLSYVNKTDKSPAKIKIAWKGLVVSFMMSVHNNTDWYPIVSAAVQKCYDHHVNDKLGTNCGLVPLALLAIIDCSYKQIFLNCVKWNPHNLIECSYSKEYVEQCMTGIRFRQSSKN